MQESAFQEFENLNVKGLLLNFREISDGINLPQYDNVEEMSEVFKSRLNDLYDFKESLQEDLSDERLQQISERIQKMPEKDLNLQAIKLEMAVCKLSSNSVFDTLAADQTKFFEMSLQSKISN